MHEVQVTAEHDNGTVLITSDRFDEGDLSRTVIAERYDPQNAHALAAALVVAANELMPAPETVHGVPIENIDLITSAAIHAVGRSAEANAWPGRYAPHSELTPKGVRLNVEIAIDVYGRENVWVHYDGRQLSLPPDVARIVFGMVGHRLHQLAHDPPQPAEYGDGTLPPPDPPYHEEAGL